MAKPTADKRKSSTKPIEVASAMPPDAIDPLSIALAEQEQILQGNPARSYADPTLPVSRLLAQEKLHALRLRFLGGERWALMVAIRECARCSVAMPNWVEEAYIKAFDSVSNLRVSSWDAAFGRPVEKASQVPALRRRRKLAIPVYSEIISRIREDPSIAIDNALFRDVGAKYGISKSTAEAYYRHALRNYGLTPAPSVKRKMLG